MVRLRPTRLKEIITLISLIELLILCDALSGAFSSTILIVLSEEVRFHKQLTNKRYTWATSRWLVPHQPELSLENLKLRSIEWWSQRSLQWCLQTTCLVRFTRNCNGGFSYIVFFTESHDFENEALKIGGFLEDICHMKDNEIVLSVRSFYFDEFLGRSWDCCQGRSFLVILDIWYSGLSSTQDEWCNWFRSTGIAYRCMKCMCLRRRTISLTVKIVIGISRTVRTVGTWYDLFENPLRWLERVFHRD